MMKEKKTSLNNNENETDLPFKPSIVSENKLQNSVFSAIGSASLAHKLVQDSNVAALLKNHESLLAGTAVSNAFAAQKLVQDSGAAAFLKNHESLLAGTAVSSAFAAHKLVQDSGAAAFLKSHESLLAGTTVSSAFAAHKLVQDSGAAAFLKSHESLLAGTAVSSAFAAQKLVQDSGAAAFLKSHESLLAGTAVSSAFAAHKLVQDSNVAAFLKSHESLLAGTTVSSASAAHKLVQDSGAAAFLKSHESLLAGTAVSSAFAAHKLVQDSGAAAFLKSHESLLADTAVSSAFAAHKLVQDSGITALFKKQGGIFNENYFATSVAKHLEKLNATEIQTLQEAAILFSRSPQGAAIIATNIHAVEVKEPDALTKLKNHIEKSPITSSFRKLPLLVQLIIIYLVTTMYSVILDKNKELAMDLIEQAQQYVSKSISPKTHLKKLTKQLPSEVAISTLKHIRIITGENVRLRNTPSMRGDVLVKLEKYTPVIVIDKSDRKWLYVQLSFGEQKIYGWVNRSYTKAINH